LRTIEAAVNIDLKDLIPNKIGGLLRLLACNGQEGVVDVLLANGASTMMTQPFTRGAALISAAMQGHTEVAEALILWDANLEARTHDGVTPLSATALGGHLITAKCLLFYNANPTAAENSEHTAWMCAKLKGHQHDLTSKRICMQMKCFLNQILLERRPVESIP